MILRTNKVVKLQKWMEVYMAQKKSKEDLEAKLKKVEADIKTTKERINKLKKVQTKLKNEIKSIEYSEFDDFISSRGMSLQDARKKLE